MMDLFDLPKDDGPAKAARDAALAQVERPAWMATALTALAKIPSGTCCTAEEVRAILLKTIPPPHHHNAWGALIRTAVRRGLLKDTQCVTHMRSIKSHGRRTPIYEKG